MLLNTKKHGWRVPVGATVALFAILVVLVMVLLRDSPPEDELPVRVDTPTPISVIESPPEVPATHVEAPATIAAPAVRGSVVQADGTPIADASVLVRVAGQTDPVADTWTGRASSDADGVFALEVAQADREYTVDVQAQGFLPDSQDMLVPQGGVKDAEFVLVPLCSVAGRVINAEGRPVAGLSLHADAKPTDAVDASGNSLRSPEPTDADGAFVLSGLYPGRYSLSATSDFRGRQRSGENYHLSGNSGQRSLVEVALKRGEQKTGLVIKLERDESEYVIEGFVRTAEGLAVADAKVWATFGSVSNPASGAAPSPTDKTGFFRINCVTDSMRRDGHLLARPAIVQCEASGYELARVSKVPWGTKDLVITVIEIQRGGISGVVLDAVTRTPVADARVSAWQIYTDWGDRWRPDYSGIRDNRNVGTRTPKDGRFEINDLPVGEVTLQVSHAVYGLSLHRIPLPIAEDAVTDVEVLLEAAGTLTIEVVAIGMLRDDKILDCRVQLTPLNVLSIEDEKPWAYSNGSLSGPAVPEASASERFANAALLVSPRFAWQKIADGHWAGTLTLAPGEYGVTVIGQYVVRGPEGASVQTYMSTDKALVQTGTDATLSFEIGGGSTIEGTLNWSPPEKRRYWVCLTANDQTELLDRFQGKMPYFVPQLAREGGVAVKCYALAASQVGSYRFSAVLPGAYTVSAYVTDPMTQETALLGREEISVEAGMAHTLNLP